MAHLNSQSIRQVAPTLLRVESLEERALLAVANLDDLGDLVDSSTHDLTAPGALDYEVQRSHDALTWTTTASELTSLELAEEDLEPNTTYYYRVGASFLNSEVRFWSSATLITTLMEDDGLLSNDTFEYIDAQPARYFNGGSLTNTYASSLSKTKTLNRSVDLTSLANYLTGSRLAERYDELAEGRWHTDSYSIVNHEDRNSNLSYNKTVEIEDAEDYIQIPTGVTLTDFQEKYELTETDSYNYDVNCTLVYNAAHNCYELADGGTGSCTRNYSFVDDSYVMATGQSAGGGSSMSPSGTVTRKWGDKTSNKIRGPLKTPLAREEKKVIMTS